MGTIQSIVLYIHELEKEKERKKEKDDDNEYKLLIDGKTKNKNYQ